MERVAMERGERDRLGDLIDKATNSPLLQVDGRLIVSIKALVRSSDDNVRAAFEVLFDKLKKNHSQVRYLAVLIIDELFTRSKLFRSLLVPVFETYTILTVGFRSTQLLPPPADRAALLKKKSLEFLEKWNDMFGQHYRPISLAHDYLKKTLRLEFPNLREIATQAGQQRKEREERTQELLKRKFEILKEKFLDLRSDVQSTLDQVGEGLAILVPEADGKWLAKSAELLDVQEEEDEFEVFGAQSLRRLRDESEGQDAVPYETRDNEAVFETLRDLHKLLVSRDLANTQDWLSTLMRVDPLTDRQSRDALLKEVIDLRNQLIKSRDRCEGIGIEPIVKDHKSSADEDLNDVIWEVGEVFPTEATGTTRGESSVSEDHAKVVSESSLRTASVIVHRKKPKTTEVSTGARQELLKEAPVLTWGSYLDSWGNESSVPVNSRGLLFENHWGKVDYDALIPADIVAENSLRSSYYKPEKMEIRPCLAPLKKGGLCQRRDLHRCLLHGPIIPRDASGHPVVVEVHEANLPPDGEKPVNNDGSEAKVRESAVRDIAEMAIENLRKKDDESRQQVTKERSLARRRQSKRAREHNDACLREASIAGTGQGFEETLGDILQDHELPSRKRTGGLTGLLKKKPTAKDRLASRLLNGRARAATVSQLVRDEEAVYRESFPNQWS